MTGRTRDAAIGEVILVGAGPGDPDLISVRGARALARADTILYDELAAAELLDLAPTSAERLNVGKRGHDAPTRSQDDINRLLVERALAGQTVVRLKGGDPFVFGRGGEEASACVAAGVPFSVVPGVTSAIAALTYAGIPITDRRHSASFAVVTGHKDPSRAARETRWRALGTAVDTVVILMGMKNLSELVQQMIEGGRDPATPAAAVMNGGLGSQRVVESELGALPQRVLEAGMGAPAAIVIGEVARLRESLTWWESTPLFGQRVLVTRPREQAGEMLAALRSAGATPVLRPMIEFDAPESWSSVDRALGELEHTDAVVFTSANAVRFLAERLRQVRPDFDFGRIEASIVCIGAKTAQAVVAAGWPIHFVPAGRGDSAGLLEELCEWLPPSGRRFLLPQSAIAGDQIAEGLSAAGGAVDVVTVYRTLQPDWDSGALCEDLVAGRLDAVTFASPSAVRHLVGSLDRAARVALARCTLAAIGPSTADALRAEGFQPDALPERPDGEALVEALARAVEGPRRGTS